jgi:hypothetical protein
MSNNGEQYWIDELQGALETVWRFYEEESIPQIDNFPSTRCCAAAFALYKAYTAAQKIGEQTKLLIYDGKGWDELNEIGKQLLSLSLEEAVKAIPTLVHTEAMITLRNQSGVNKQQMIEDGVTAFNAALKANGIDRGCDVGVNVDKILATIPSSSRENYSPDPIQAAIEFLPIYLRAGNKIV